MDKLGLIPEIAPRYRSTYFGHIIGGYAADIIVICANVLDNDVEDVKRMGYLIKKRLIYSVPDFRTRR